MACAALAGCGGTACPRRERRRGSDRLTRLRTCARRGAITVNSPRLFHVSEQAGIDVFVPRDPPNAKAGIDTPVVWAVDADHLANYLLPRDCPRVAFRVQAGTPDAERREFMGHGGANCVVAIEARWFGRAVRSALWLYQLPSDGFECADATAGYFVSPRTVRPVSSTRVDEPIERLLASGAELRVLPDLLALADAVAASSLAFSCIRMRNAGNGHNPR